MKTIVFHPLTLAMLFAIVGFAGLLLGANAPSKWRTEKDEATRKLLEQDINDLRSIRAELIEEIQEMNR